MCVTTINEKGDYGFDKQPGKSAWKILKPIKGRDKLCNFIISKNKKVKN